MENYFDIIKTADGFDIRTGGVLTLNGRKIRAENDILYDKYSSDSKVNLGKTGGIKGGESITYDFSPYRKLIIYIYSYQMLYTGIIDLEFNHSGDYIIAPLVQSEEQYNQQDVEPSTYFAGISVPKDKQSLLNKTMGYFYNTKYTLRNNNTSYYIYKIEGVL